MSVPDLSQLLHEIRAKVGLSQESLARALGVSFVSVNRWERGTSIPSPAQSQKISELYQHVTRGVPTNATGRPGDSPFASHGAGERIEDLPLFSNVPGVTPALSDEPMEGVLERITRGRFYEPNGEEVLCGLLRKHSRSSKTPDEPARGGLSAGKNSYTYDAHTYHTKVPPQGIAELLDHYLPEGGLVVDPFAGSGMTGVAAIATGRDCILNELAPAACFIASRFTRKIDLSRFSAVANAVLDSLREIREKLYSTICRECGRRTEVLYTIWSYRVVCSACHNEFLLWDHCRRYGKRVKEHRILTQFPCPACGFVVKKSRLRRTIAEPVLLGYKCCGSRQQEVLRELTLADLQLTYATELVPTLAAGYYPTTVLPQGINLNQPRRHGLTSVDRFYTARNLSALSHLWKTIHRVKDDELAAHLAFAFTSLYQRVTKLSEFRFWGGSGNTARFNVPFVFNEANVFLTFERKLRSIRDHLATTARWYKGEAVVIQGSATDLDMIPDESVDLVFTDPPFGANINYSEMNILWESWLGRFTDPSEEAIINRSQGKTIREYGDLIQRSLLEAFRVLRKGHWMLMVFMNSSASVWALIKDAVASAGFELAKVDVFDKEHGTFKQFVSENTAGCDLVLHCRKPVSVKSRPDRSTNAIDPGAQQDVRREVEVFLASRELFRYRVDYLHVEREQEWDIRKLYSEFVGSRIMRGGHLLDLATFRALLFNMMGRKR